MRRRVLSRGVLHPTNTRGSAMTCRADAKGVFSCATWTTTNFQRRCIASLMQDIAMGRSRVRLISGAMGALFKLDLTCARPLSPHAARADSRIRDASTCQGCTAIGWRHRDSSFEFAAEDGVVHVRGHPEFRRRCGYGKGKCLGKGKWSRLPRMTAQDNNT